MEYKFKAIDANGKQIKSTVIASSDEGFYAELKRRNLQCIDFSIADSHSGKKYKRLNLKETASFCSQFSILIQTGVPITDALEELIKQEKKSSISNSYLFLLESVQKGTSLSQSMKDLGNVFPNVLVYMIEVGEKSSSLGEIMNQMSDYYTKEDKSRSRAKNAMTYPVVLLTVTFFVTIALFTFVMPQFMSMFEGSELPAISRVMMSLSNFFLKYWMLIICGVVAIVFIFLALKQTERGAYVFSKIKCSLPVLGKLQTQTYIARFTSAMNIMSSTNVDTISAIRTAASALDNRYLEVRFNDVLSAVASGVSLSSAMEEYSVFDPFVRSMIHTGEATGQSAEVYKKTAAYYDSASELASQKMVALSEPIIIMIVGVVIGTVLISIFLPMYSMYSNIM